MLLIIFLLLSCIDATEAKAIRKGFSNLENFLYITLRDEDGNFLNELNIKLTNNEKDILGIFKNNGQYFFDLKDEIGKFFIKIENKGYSIKGNNLIKIIDERGKKYFKCSSEYVVKKEKLKGSKVFFSSNIESLTFELIPLDEKNKKFLLPTTNFETSRVFKEEDLGNYILFLKKNEKVIERFEASLKNVDNNINIFINNVNKLTNVKFDIDYEIDNPNIFSIEKEFKFLLPLPVLEMVKNKSIDFNVKAIFDKNSKKIGSKDNVELIDQKFEDNKLLIRFIREGRESTSFPIKLNIKLGIFEFSKDYYLKSFYKDNKMELLALDNVSNLSLNVEYAVAKMHLKEGNNLIQSQNLVIKREDKEVPFVINKDIKEIHFINLVDNSLKFDNEIKLKLDVKGFMPKETTFNFTQSGIYNFNINFEKSLPILKIIEEKENNNYSYKIISKFDKNKRYSSILLLKLKNEDKFVAYKDFYLDNNEEINFNLSSSLLGKNYEEERGKLKLYLLFKEEYLESSVLHTSFQTILSLEDENIKYFGTFDEKSLFDNDSKSIKPMIDPDNLIKLDGTTFFRGLNDKFLTNLFHKAISKINYNINKLHFNLFYKENNNTYSELANTKLKIIKEKSNEEIIYDDIEGIIKRKPIYHFSWLDDEKVRDFISKIRNPQEKLYIKICVDCSASKLCKEFSLDNSLDIFFNNRKVDIENIKYLDNFSTKILELEEEIFPIISSQTYKLKMSYEKSENGNFKKEDEFCSEVLKNSNGNDKLVLRENNVIMSKKNGIFGQNFDQEIGIDEYLLEFTRITTFNGIAFCLSNINDKTRTATSKVLNGALACMGTAYLLYSHLNPDILGNHDKKSWGSNFKLLGKDDKNSIPLDNYMAEKLIQYDYANSWEMYVYIPENINLEKDEFSKKYFPNSNLLTSGKAKLRVIRELRELDNTIIYKVEETKSDFYNRKNSGNFKTTKGWKLFILREDKRGLANSINYDPKNSGWAIFTNIPFKIFRHTSEKLERVSNKTINLQSGVIDN